MKTLLNGEMKKMLSLRLLLLLLGLFVASLGAKPNVIVILIDDMGWADSSTYGSSYYQTPNLTRLSKEGVLFTNAYAASPLCSPTRASIMTGQYPSRLKMTAAITPKSVTNPKALAPKGKQYCGKVQSRDHLPLEVNTLSKVLKGEGYSTAHIGKWHLAPKKGGEKYHADHFGFDFVIGGAHLPGPPDYYSPYKNGIRNLTPGPSGEYINERLALESIKWIESVCQKGEPFFLNLWHYAVHGPIIAKKDLLPKYIERRNPKNPQRCPEMGTMLESMDNSVGMLLNWLDKPENKSIKDNTLIILTSDNGGVTHKDMNGNIWTANRPLRGGKANTYEGGVRVPFIVKWPGNMKTGSVSDEPVQSIDIFPTVMDAVGIQKDQGMTLDGVSILPTLNGKALNERPLFTDFPHIFGILCAPSSSVRLGDWKLIRYYHAGKGEQVHGYELFNLEKDLYESIDLASYYPEKVDELSALIEEHLKETDALVPIRNERYKGNRKKPRSNKSAKYENRPKSLHLGDKEVVSSGGGSKKVQLVDDKGKARDTHFVIIEGEDWVFGEGNKDGSVTIKWKASNGRSAKVLFGWKGGATCFDINDWTLPACELVIR